jgi:tetratricopeptide (TPR) repeat protein
MGIEKYAYRMSNRWIAAKTPVVPLFVLILLHTVFIPAFSQIDPEAQYEIIMEEGVDLMDAGDYEGADKKFKQVLRNMEVLPADITFYFGKNSYFLDQYKQSINWLNKYIELKGTQGRFFDECVNYLKRAEMAYNLETERNTRQVYSEFSQLNEFDCKGHSYFQCPLCSGEGVLIKPGKMNNTIYQTCPFCKGNGILSCEEYKKYLKGELKAED